MRTGLISTAALSLALLAGSPALAAEDALPLVGAECTPGTDYAPLAFVCDDSGHVALATEAPPAEPEPTPSASAPADTDPPADPAPTATPTPEPTLPVGGDGGGILPGGSGGDGTSDSGSGTGTGTGTSGDSGGSTSGGSASGQPVDTTTDGTTKPGTTLHAAANELTPASATKGMLAAATISNLASSDLPTLAAMRSLPVVPGSAGLPLSAYTPSPLIANLPATTALSSVQAPLLAIGDDAAGGSGFTLAGLSSRALPGLLVVLATALVATVGAGNLRYWQERFGTRR